VKFVTRARGAVVLGAVLIGVHALLTLSRHSLERDWMPTAVSVGLLVFACLLFVLVNVYRGRVKGQETLEIGRRGLMITEPNTVPYALAWRMIRSADLQQSVPQQWRFLLKTGGEVLLLEEAFSREQWKKISAQLERKFKARGIPVRVI
jgi:hypothetical protein